MIKDILSGCRDQFPASAHTELRAQINRERAVSMLSGNIYGNTRSESCGVSARTLKNGVYGFASMAELSAESAAKVLRASAENAAFLDKHINKAKSGFPALSGGNFVMDVDVADPEQKIYVDLVRQMDDYIVRKCPGLAGRYVGVRSQSFEKMLMTGDGMNSHTILPRAMAMVELTVEGNSGTPVNVFDVLADGGTILMYAENPQIVFDKIDLVYERVMQKKSGIYPEAGVKTVVLAPEMAGMLSHEAVGHTVEADLVLAGSVAGSMLGKQVASEKISMTDFANTAFGKKVPLPVYVDDEGTKAVDAPLIKDGILVGYMNSRETASHSGVEPTGNMRAWDFSDEPLIRMRNTAILPGRDKLEDMIASVDDGYYLISSGNGQADATGEFMFGVTCGYEIKKGKLGRALLDTTVSGVAFDMLKTVDMVSDSVEWSAGGTCGKKQMMACSMGGPALRCKLLIGGR